MNLLPPGPWFILYDIRATGKLLHENNLNSIISWHCNCSIFPAAPLFPILSARRIFKPVSRGFRKSWRGSESCLFLLSLSEVVSGPDQTKISQVRVRAQWKHHLINWDISIKEVLLRGKGTFMFCLVYGNYLIRRVQIHCTYNVCTVIILYG